MISDKMETDNKMISVRIKSFPHHDEWEVANSGGLPIDTVEKRVRRLFLTTGNFQGDRFEISKRKLKHYGLEIIR